MRAMGDRRGAARVFATAACVAAIAGSLTACGDIKQASSTTPAKSSGGGNSPSALVPSSVRSTGDLVIGTNVPYPPMEYYKANHETYTGADIDLIEAIAHGLGLKPKIENINWDGLIPAADSGRIDAIVASMADFTDREKQANFVDYLKSGAEIEIPKADASQYTSLMSLCGKSMSVETGTVEVTAAHLLSKQCQSAGKPPVSSTTFDQDSDALLAQESGRVQLHATDSPVAQYEAATIDGGRRFDARFPDFLTTPIEYGVATAKANLGLARAIKAELDVLIKNGTYAKILRHYHLQSLAVHSAALNAATVSSTGAK